VTRTAQLQRRTGETDVELTLTLDGTGAGARATGVGFLDHMLDLLARHGRLDLDIQTDGDLQTGAHHTAEDTGIVLGQALDQALGDRRGIARYGDAVVPMDDAIARAAVDLGGRAHSELSIEPDPGMATHMLQSLAQAARASIHVQAEGRDAHHVAEAAFKAVGRSLRAAVRSESAGLPSTKGVL
jgi:imidazoleglycerol-phosphate dehydratase